MVEYIITWIQPCSTSIWSWNINTSSPTVSWSWSSWPSPILLTGGLPRVKCDHHDSPVEMSEVLYLHLRLSGANAPGVPNLRVRRRATPNWQPPRNMGGKKWSKKCLYIYIYVYKILYKYPVGDICILHPHKYTSLLHHFSIRSWPPSREVGWCLWCEEPLMEWKGSRTAFRWSFFFGFFPRILWLKFPMGFFFKSDTFMKWSFQAV